MKKVYHIGRHYDGEVFVKAEYTDGRLSLSGVIGPKRNGDTTGEWGQIQDSLSDLRSLAPGWTLEKVDRLLAIWREWHLNDMQAGCEHQRAERWAEHPIDPTKPLNAYGRHFPGQAQDSWNMLIWVTRREHPQGLLSEPCPVCGYKYGTAWLKVEVPASVIDELEAFPDADITPAWV